MTPARRTYWHLEAARRKPSDYDIASSRLLYHRDKGFAVATPGAAWHRRHADGSSLVADDWEGFRDPLETTYRAYTERQHEREVYVDGLLRTAEAADYVARLDAEWLGALDRILPALRYVAHGLQMVSAYVAHLAPASRIVIAGLFQAADELRRIQRFAYRMRQLQLVVPGFGSDSRATWQSDAAWQPMRRALERLLTTYDWGEALVALELVAKPAIDAITLDELGCAAAKKGDHVLEQLLGSLADDARWHRAWSSALVAWACRAEPANVARVAEWIGRWRPAFQAAVEPIPPLWGDHDGAALAGLDGRFRELWRDAGVTVEDEPQAEPSELARASRNHGGDS
jgi:toluene monooxygenase system protein E